MSPGWKSALKGSRFSSSSAVFTVKETEQRTKTVRRKTPQKARIRPRASLETGHGQTATVVLGVCAILMGPKCW